MDVGDVVELEIGGIDRVSGRVIGYSEDRKTIFTEMRLGLPPEKVRRSPELPPPTYRCSFCSKSANEVQQLVAGDKACICNECVSICADIIAKSSSEVHE